MLSTTSSKKQIPSSNSRFFSLLLLFIIGASTAHANWYSDGTKKNSDIIMKETRYPVWSKGWYNAFWNGRFYPQGGRYYGGFAAYPPKDITKHLAYKPELVWTFWGSPAYKGNNLKNIYIPPQGIDFKGHGLEGAQGGATGRPQFMKPNTWFTTLMRTWPSANDPDVSYVGQWIKDMDTKEWHTVPFFRFPVGSPVLVEIPNSPSRSAAKVPIGFLNAAMLIVASKANGTI